MADIPREAVEGLRDEAREKGGNCHLAYAEALTAILDARPDQEGVRRVRADGIPQGIRDCCSECQEVAWESCFIRGQCRRYLTPAPTDQEVEQD